MILASNHIRPIRPAESWATPVCVMHGLLGNKGNFKSFGRRLSGSLPTEGHESIPRDVYTLDLRNHGHSFHDPSMRIEDMASDVIRFLDASGIDRTFLIGHSLGGTTAMACALMYPSRVAGMVVVDVAPYRYRFQKSEFEDTIPEILFSMSDLDVDKVQSREDAFVRLKGIKSTMVKQFCLQNLRYDKDTKKYAWRCNLQAFQDNLLEIRAFQWDLFRESPYDGPVRFLSGDKSQYIKVERDSERIHSLFPKYEIESVSNAGHWLHRENPEEFFQKTVEFLDEYHGFKEAKERFHMSIPNDRN